MSGLDDEHPARRRAAAERKALSVRQVHLDPPCRGRVKSARVRGVVVETPGRDLHSRIIAIAINIINTWW